MEWSGHGHRVLAVVADVSAIEGSRGVRIAIAAVVAPVIIVASMIVIGGSTVDNDVGNLIGVGIVCKDVSELVCIVKGSHTNAYGN